MPPTLVPTDTGALTISVGVRGSEDTTKGFITSTEIYSVPAVDRVFFVADRPYRVMGIRGRNTVIGTGGACTCVIRKAADGVAMASGTALHSGSYNLVGTADTMQALTLSTTSSDLDLATGDALVADYTGTATSATGAITVTMAPK